MFGVFPLTPAYGRDYKSKAEIIADLKDGKDFQTACGQYCSLRDFPNEDLVVRHNNLKDIVFIKVKDLE